MKYKELFIAVLIVALFIAVFDGQLQRKKMTEFDGKEKVLKLQLDSLTELQHQTDLQAIRAMTDLNVAIGQLKAQSHVTEKFRNRYEVLRNTAVPRLTDAQIDSAVNRLYPVR